VYNRFGFRRVFFDRIDSVFPEALAWIPQSTVALNTYAGALQLERHYWPDQLEPNWMPKRFPEDLEGILLQTHDSVNFQFRDHRVPLLQEIKNHLSVTIPYEDPLIIPWDIKRSAKSWGEMQKMK